jgi:hypothetical protein
MAQSQLTVLNGMFKDSPSFANGHGNNRHIMPRNKREVFWVWSHAVRHRFP